MKAVVSATFLFAAIILLAILAGRYRQPVSKPPLPEQVQCKSGRHGMMGLVIPVCSTSDGGEECFDDFDCQGSCLAPEFARRGSRTIGHCTRTDYPFGSKTRVEGGIVGETIYSE